MTRNQHNDRTDRTRQYQPTRTHDTPSMPPIDTNDPTDRTVDATTTVAFVCVRNAGRSQMATAFAERERAERNLENDIAIVTGGTDPADDVHDVVVDALDEVGLDVNGRNPRRIDESVLAECDVVATMGCSTLDLDGVENVDWDLEDPGEKELAEVKAIRDEVEQRVIELFDELSERIK